MERKPLILTILDGFGIEEDYKKSAILQAKTPNLDNLFSTYPNTQIGACGRDVGLPEGQMGNSEVGHLNIGAGRIVYQELSRISNEIENGEFFQNNTLVTSIKKAVKNNRSVHIMGLLSDGGVHSHISHIKAIVKLANELEVVKIYIHCFLDGRDVPPKSALSYLDELSKYLCNVEGASIGSISGRYYAMDRDNRWDRVKLAYDTLTTGNGSFCDTYKEAIDSSYKQEITDEFIVPTIIDKDSLIKDGDTVIMANFRPDRARELTRAFVDDNFSGFERNKISNITFVTMTQYDKKIKNVYIAYPPEEIQNTLGEVVSNSGLKQLRIAETEKYAHVTFFLNGGKETEYPKEDRVLIPSPKIATYDLKPEMSGFEVTENLLKLMDQYDLIILNFANADMVGHTGKMEAAIKAIESIDIFIGKLVDKLLQINGQMILTADHGNADYMINDDGKVVTAHSLNPVPFIYIGYKELKLREGGVLADIAPTLLDLLGIEKPKEMTGKSLII